MLTMTRGNIIDERYLKEVDTPEVRQVISNCKAMRSHHRTHNKGWSNDRTMRDFAMIPNEIYWNPKFAMIFHNPDPIEGAKARKAFYERFPVFKTVD